MPGGLPVCLTVDQGVSRQAATDIRNLIAIVQEETGKTRLLDTAARMFLVVAEIGVNFLAYLTNIRMEQAKKLLLSMPLSIAEVSERSGYGDYRVFTKAFKKSEGVTPSPYRRNFLEE